MSYNPKSIRIKSDRERDRSRTFSAKRATLERKAQQRAKRAIREVSR